MPIAEVSEKHNLSLDTLRYNERIGLIPKVNRTKAVLEIIQKMIANG